MVVGLAATLPSQAVDVTVMLRVCVSWLVFVHVTVTDSEPLPAVSPLMVTPDPVLDPDMDMPFVAVHAYLSGLPWPVRWSQLTVAVLPTATLVAPLMAPLQGPGLGVADTVPLYCDCWIGNVVVFSRHRKS